MIPNLELQNKFENFFLKIVNIKNSIKERIGFVEELLNKKMDEYFGGDSNA